MTVRVRFAPSPTGHLHIGGARTALFNWLFARHHGGRFILRIEDTDQKRTVDGAAEEFMASLRWLGLEWDEGPDVGGEYGPYVQSERVDIYQKWTNWLVENGHAYKAFETAEELALMREEQKASGGRLGYDGRGRDLTASQIAQYEAEGREYVIRFKMPQEGTTSFYDAIRQDTITFDNEQLNDLVLLKADGFPTYHLANVVDDHLMQITHILRADEWINTAPLHVHIYKAFGWEAPVYAHLPVVLSPSGRGKLSKRDQAFQEDGVQVLVQVREFIEAGYLPEAVVNFLANVGWSFGNDREMFTMAEAIERFDLPGVSPAPTKLPYAKLEWLNGQYIQQMEPLALAQAIKPFLERAGYEVNVETLLHIVPSISMRLKRLDEAAEWLRFLFEHEPLSLTAEQLTHKKMPHKLAVQAFIDTREFVKHVSRFDVDTIAAGMQQIGEANTENGTAGPFLGTMRLALTGQQVSPPLFESMVALGRERVLARLDEALALLHKE